MPVSLAMDLPVSLAMDLDLNIKCEPGSPSFFGRCSQQSLEDSFLLGREVLPDYSNHEDYSPDHTYPSENKDLLHSIDPCSSPSSTEGCKTDYCSSSLSSDQEAADSPKKICLVCGDIASGYHYGVSSCEACKAFFKRTIQGNIEYSCPAAGDCEITKRRRKACQACRFQKCLNVGMLKEGVRLDRVRGGRQKYKRSPDSQVIVVHQQLHHSRQNNNNNNNHQLSLHSHHHQQQHLPYHQIIVPSKKLCTEENKLVSSLLSVEGQLDRLLALPDPSMPDDDVKFMSIMSDLADRELVLTISWAKQVPGFVNLSLSDQMNLLQHSWLDILCFNLSYRSTPYNGQLVIAEDFKISEEKATLFKSPVDLDNLSRKLAKKITLLGVTTEEYVLIKALVLYNPDANVDNEEAVYQSRDKVQDCLIDYVKRRSGGNMRRVGNILLLLPVLTQIKLLAKKYWFDVKKDGRVPMHKLFLEMLEADS